MLSFYAFEEFRMKEPVIAKQLFTEPSLGLGVSPNLVSITSLEVRKQSQEGKVKVSEQESKQKACILLNLSPSLHYISLYSTSLTSKHLYLGLISDSSTLYWFPLTYKQPTFSFVKMYYGSG